MNSILKDYKYKELNLCMKELVAYFMPDQNKLISLLVSDESRKVFIFVRHGQFNYSINQFFLEGQFIDHIRNYLFSTSQKNGFFIIMDIQNPGQKQFAKQKTNLNEKIKIRSI
ncbi:unnamed protein product [Paramecium pentaurelia]|uniref:Uncharacterized protein n=1 Tax=Paramecium pentaurelia TaxID=43138 RepID=A0A8S1VU60_9CILI|nr:unnamed protein product [Paramecium pentaurelia]